MTTITATAVKTIQEYRKQGYTVELKVDSTRPLYQMLATSQTKVERFTLPLSIPIDTLHKALRDENKRPSGN